MNPNNAVLTSTEGKFDALRLAEQLVALTGAALSPTKVEGAYFVSVPNGYNHKEVTSIIEAAQPAPNRQRGTVMLKDLPSLLAYATDQNARDQGYMYADIDGRKIVAIFNDQRIAGGTGWRDHRAVFHAEHTPEYLKWVAHNGPKVKFSQGEFAEFLEDNQADLHEEHANILLTVATTMQAKTDINFSSAKRLDNGQNQLVYTEVIDARAGAGGALQIPQVFKLGLAIFKNGAAYEFPARLKYRLRDGSVSFWYELDRPEKRVEAAFAAYVDKVRADSGYSVLLGTP